MLSKRILVLMFLLVFLLSVGCFPSPALPNQAPIITSDPVATATVGEAYTYDVGATDPDGDTMTYSLITKPTGMVINSATGLIGWTPAAKGDYDVVVKVSDGALDITQSFTIVVSKPWAPSWTPPAPPVNHAPIITSIPGNTAIVGVEYTYTIKATDQDGDTIIYSLVSEPAGMTFDDIATISWTPVLGQIGPNDVTVKASDGKKDTSQSFTITVEAVKVIRIEASPDTMTLLNLEKRYLIVIAYYNDGSTSDVTLDCIYVSTDIQIALVVTPGLVEAWDFGKATITVTYTPNGEVFGDTVEITVGPVHNVNLDTYHNTIQVGIDEANPGNTIEVAAGTYNERLTISNPLDLKGAPGNESVITLAGVKEPKILIEIPPGISNVSVTGFTLIGSATSNVADEAVVRCWDDNVTIEDNIINGYMGVLYKGPGQGLTVHNNHFIVNKAGVICQPGGGSNITISDNVIILGSSPADDQYAIYMTGCSQSSVTGNTAADFIHGSALGGSTLDYLTVSGNALTGNARGVCIWGSSTFITITDNVLSNSVAFKEDEDGCGISIKGSDLVITGNQINNNANIGVRIDKHRIDTERVTISSNNITGNANYGIWVNTSEVTEIVDATNNWWGDATGPYHPTANSGGLGDTVSDNVNFDPWTH